VSLVFRTVLGLPTPCRPRRYKERRPGGRLSV